MRTEELDRLLTEHVIIDLLLPVNAGKRRIVATVLSFHSLTNRQGWCIALVSFWGPSTHALPSRSSDFRRARNGCEHFTALVGLTLNVLGA